MHGQQGHRRGDPHRLKALTDILRGINGAIATVATFSFRAAVRLFGGASDSAYGHH
ncbi:LPFR motif small protein [Streptomyces sp. CA2R101]|uniref:LPFR motif small protein n=1 Tax=Streptomyces sp. CA2R101 TaxID=3120152 RepID=UPI003FA698D8